MAPSPEPLLSTLDSLSAEPEEDFDEVEYMPPKPPVELWTPPEEWHLPDYGEVGREMRRRAEGWCDYDDERPVDIEVEEMKVDWAMPQLEMAELGTFFISYTCYLGAGGARKPVFSMRSLAHSPSSSAQPPPPAQTLATARSRNSTGVITAVSPRCRSQVVTSRGAGVDPQRGVVNARARGGALLSLPPVSLPLPLNDNPLSE
jgi:hypothetical protein